MSMNQRTFNAWIRALGYVWVGQEEMLKGFMTEAEARSYIADYESVGRLKQRG